MNTAPHDHIPPHPGWFKSTFSPSQGGCVEVRFDGPKVLIRDTKDQGKGPELTVPAAAWPGFIAEVTGTAPAGSNEALRIEQQADGAVRLRAIDTPVTLSYTPTEWTAFVAGAVVGEFALQPAALASWTP